MRWAEDWVQAGIYFYSYGYGYGYGYSYVIALGDSWGP